MKKLLSALSLAIVASSSFAKSGGQLSTVQLTDYVMQAAANNPVGNFLNYRVEGLCFWLDCSGFWCSVEPTLKLNQFEPDAVVSVFNRIGEDPWDIGYTVIDPIANTAGQAQMRAIDGYAADNGDSGPTNNHSMMKRYKEVDVVGNPALSAFRGFSKTMISSVASPLVPYYLSLSDAELWHEPIVEDLHYPMYLVPGIRQEGSLYDDWGNIFPRIGYVTQPGDYKAAAVLALRGADIATNTGQLHVYNYLQSMSCGQACRVWPSKENDSQDVEYQEIYPTPTINNTNPFGSSDLGQVQEYNQSDYQKGKGNYVFVLWRHYEGCVQGNGSFIGET